MWSRPAGVERARTAARGAASVSVPTNADGKPRAVDLCLFNDMLLWVKRKPMANVAGGQPFKFCGEHRQRNAHAPPARSPTDSWLDPFFACQA